MYHSWDVSDQVYSGLFDKTALAYPKVGERSETFVKRVGFALIAAPSVHDKKAEDGKLADFFPLILREATDARGFGKKAANWVLRQR